MSEEPKYLTPINIELGQILKAYAVKTNWNDSSLLTASFIQRGTVTIPKAIPEGGTYIAGQVITLNTATQNALIYYTIDGTNPSEYNGIKYIEPFTLTSNAMIKAIAIANNMNDSAIMIENYNINHFYIVGYYNDGLDGYDNTLRQEFGYWKNGQKQPFSSPIGGSNARPRGITASSDGNIYIAGDAFFTSGRRAFYWINEQCYELIGSGNANPQAFSIAVENNNVYVAGHYGASRPIPCYWVNGQRIDLQFPGFESTMASTTSIAVSNGNVYISGYYGWTNSQRACYWINEQMIELPFSGNRSSATSITLNNNDIYISGWYDDGNGNTIACYWKNEEKFDLPALSTSTSNINANANAIIVNNGNIYIAGNYTYQLNKWLCYWENGQLINIFRSTLGIIRNITVFNDKVFVVGNNGSRAFYWIDGNTYELSNYGTYSDAYGIIIIE